MLVCLTFLTFTIEHFNIYCSRVLNVADDVNDDIVSLKYVPDIIWKI